jgi:hypothetical protein
MLVKTLEPIATIGDVIEHKKMASSPKAGPVHNSAEYGKLDTVLVSGSKVGISVVVENQKSAVNFALLKLINAFSFMISSHNLAARVLDHNIVVDQVEKHEFGFCSVLGDGPALTDATELPYQVKRTNSVIIGPSGKAKKRTTVKFLLPKNSALEHCMLEPLSTLLVESTNGYSLIKVPGNERPLASVYSHDDQTTVSIEI